MSGTEAGLETPKSPVKNDNSKGFFGGETKREQCGSFAKRLWREEGLRKESGPYLE